MSNVTPLFAGLAALIAVLAISLLVLWGFDLLTAQELAPRHRAFSTGLA